MVDKMKLAQILYDNISYFIAKTTWVKPGDRVKAIIAGQYDEFKTIPGKEYTCTNVSVFKSIELNNGSYYNPYKFEMADK